MIFWQLLTDKTAGWFTNRVVTLVGASAATIIMFWLMAQESMTVDYFEAYMLWVVGHATAAKYLDRKYPKGAS